MSVSATNFSVPALSCQLSVSVSVIVSDQPDLDVGVYINYIAVNVCAITNLLKHAARRRRAHQCRHIVPETYTTHTRSHKGLPHALRGKKRVEQNSVCTKRVRAQTKEERDDKRRVRGGRSLVCKGRAPPPGPTPRCRQRERKRNLLARALETKLSNSCLDN